MSSVIFFTNDGFETWQEYIMEGLKGKTLILVTHQVDFLPAFDSILVSSFNLGNMLCHCSC